jgi:hypothetical protein
MKLYTINLRKAYNFMKKEKMNKRIKIESVDSSVKKEKTMKDLVTPVNNFIEEKNQGNFIFNQKMNLWKTRSSLTLFSSKDI